MQAYELWKLEQDAKLIIKEMNKVEAETKQSQTDTKPESWYVTYDMSILVVYGLAVAVTQN